MQRRDLLAAMLALLGTGGIVLPARAQDGDWNKPAFDALNLKDAMRLWGVGPVQESKDIVFLNTWDIAENGAVVPLELQSRIPNTESLTLFADKNPQPLVGSFAFSGAESYVSTRIKLGETTLVRAIVRAGGKYYAASKEIRVTIGGCGEHEVGAPPTGRPSGEPMRTKAVLRGEIAEIKVLMSHPMETGRRKDVSGKLIPAYHIRNVQVNLNGKQVMRAQWGTPVSRNPFLGLRIPGAHAGDKIAITWVDTAGERGSVETTVN